MQRTCRLLAESLAARPSLDLRRVSATLYPPIPLYRRLLRAHRNLPREMRSLGDRYVKAEFRLHREVTNPVHVMGFLTQWKRYLDELPRDPSAKNFKKLDSTIFEKMSPEQLSQLYELMHATRGVWKPVSSENGVEDSRS
ncbi:ACN9-domain-containing protein [Pisolithus tinctorius]|nr:ACN9-domain-containing protein [Pisolithus tinctorius]